MADEGSLELAPLRAKVVLDLTQFDEGMEQIADKTDELKDIKVPVKINLNNNPEDLEEVIEEIKETAQQTAESFFDILDEVEQADEEVLELANSFRNLGDAMENATQTQEEFNTAVKQTKVDVSEYNQEAMEFIAGAERQAEATQESTEQLHTNGTAVAENATMVEKWGNDWWTTATMAMMSIQMITSSMGELLNTGAEVELAGIGLTETFGKQGAEAIKNFTQNANDANLTLQEVLPTAQTLGLALRQYGGTKTEIAGVTTQIMNMANQLQLATGGAVSFSEGADAIKQELAGQSYALKSLGINLSNTLLNQTALNSQWHTSYNKLDSYQQAVIKVDALQGQLNKTFGTTSTYLKSQAGQYEKNIAEFKNNMAKLGEDLLPLANAILPSILKIVEKIVSVVDKIKSNKWLVNKIEWFTKLALTGGTVALALAIVGKAFAMVTKRIRYVILATKDMVSIFKGASRFSEMRTGIGKLILAFKKLIVGIGKGTATIVKTIPKIGKAFIQVGKVIGRNGLKIASILKKTVVGAILKCSSSIKTIAVALGTKIINLISEGMLTSKVIFLTLQGIISTAIEGVVGKLTVFATVIKTTVIPAVLEFLADIGPIGWTLLATIGIMTLVYEAWKHNWFNIRNIVKTAIRDIKNILKSLRLTGVLHFFKALNNLCTTFQKYSEKSFKSMVNTILGSLKGLGSGAKGIWDEMKSTYDKFMDYEEEKTKKNNEQIKNNTLKSWNDTKNSLKGIFGDIYDSLAESQEKQQQSTKRNSAYLQEVSNHAWKGIANFAESCLSSLGNFCNNKLNELGSFFSNTLNDIGNLWTQFWNSIGVPVINALDYVGEICWNAWNEFWDFLGNIAVDVLNWIGNLGAEALNSVNSFLNNILGDIFGGEQSASNSSFISFANANDVASLSAVPTVNNFSTTNITNTTSNNLASTSAQTQAVPMENIPTIGELHIHSPQTLDPLETYNQMQQWSINMANGLY